MNWHVYRKDDPNSWPEIDCPMLVYVKYRAGTEELHVCRFDNRFKQFYGMCNLEVAYHAYAFTECYYQYIGYVPNGYKVLKFDKCMAELQVRCDFDDDGYCMDVNNPCPFRKTVNEYAFNDNKRIWKEFE